MIVVMIDKWHVTNNVLSLSQVSFINAKSVGTKLPNKYGF